VPDCSESSPDEPENRLQSAFVLAGRAMGGRWSSGGLRSWVHVDGNGELLCLAPTSVVGTEQVLLLCPAGGPHRLAIGVGLEIRSEHRGKGAAATGSGAVAPTR
jgi:hypothetical protein